MHISKPPSPRQSHSLLQQPLSHPSGFASQYIITYVLMATWPSDFLFQPAMATHRWAREQALRFRENARRINDYADYAASADFAEYDEMLTSKRKADRRRPVWEPAPKSTNADLTNIETGPSSEEDAMNSLLRQGCHWPPKHYRKDHECRIPALRLEALRQIKRWKKARPILELMMAKLPDELNLLILQHVVLDTQKYLHFKRQDEPRRLTDQASLLLGRWEGVDPLIPLAEQAILENTIVQCDVEFQRAATGPEKIAVLPPLVSSLPHPLRHLQLQIRFEIPAGRQKYPAAIYTATSGMPSLCAQLPGLRSLHLLMLIDLNHAPRDPHRGGGSPPILRTCRKGFSGESTFLQAIADLVDAARTARPGVTTTIEIRYDHEYQWYSPPMWKPLPDIMSVEAGASPATDVVREAEMKWA